MPLTYVNSLNEILGNHERKEAIEKAVRKLGSGARLPGSTPEPQEFFTGDVRQAIYPV